jgi:hypothetical protein
MPCALGFLLVGNPLREFIDEINNSNAEKIRAEARNYK